jgi:ATP-dependent Clp protease ATP-binding subunit ClpC
MFERYTEAARRTLFFARYEASQLGTLTIETEHVLLGILRGGKTPTQTIFERAQLSYESARKAVQTGTASREKIPTSIEIPFSPETKRVLQHAAEEADRLGHSYIGTEHLLLGLLREERCAAASILARHGLTLDVARATIVELLNEAGRRSAGIAVDGLDPGERIERIRQRVDELGALAGTQVRDLIAHIQRDLDELKRRLG